MRHWFSAALILILARSGTIIKKGRRNLLKIALADKGIIIIYLFIYLRGKRWLVELFMILNMKLILPTIWWYHFDWTPLSLIISA